LAALGAKVRLAGVVGDDSEGMLACKRLTERGVDVDAVLPDASRPTTVKERYIGRAQQRHPQQMIRVDYEVRDAINAPIERSLANTVTAQLADTDIILISDYDKGVCTPTLLAGIIAAAQRARVRVVADPIRGQD